MFKKQIILFFTLILYVNITCAQNRKKADSLIKILNSQKLSSVQRASVLESIAYNHPNLDSALYFSKESLKLGVEIQNPILQAEAWEQIALTEDRLGNNSQSLQATFKALKIYERLNLTERQAASQTQIATYYLGEREYVLAITYLERARNIYNESDNNFNTALTLINLGEAYRLSGQIEKARTTFEEAIELNKTLSENIVLGYALGNLGMIYSVEGDFKRAEENLEQAIRILTKLEDVFSVSIYLSELGLIYQRENNFDLAETKFLQAYKMAEHSGLKEQVRNFSAMLVALYEEQNSFQKALAYQKIYQTYQDSLVNKTNIKKIEQLKAGYEIDKRESEIERINVISSNRKNISIGLAIGIIIFALLSFLLYKAYKKIGFANKDLSKQKAELSLKEQEKALLLKELNHRVKNNLQMVSSLLNLQSNSITDDSAKDLIASGKNRVEALSLVHRKLYQEGIETKVEIKPYVEELVLNLLHGYSANVKPDFDIESINIDVDKAIPLALIINELVTNTIKHAYTNTVNPKLEIIIKEHQNHLNLEVVDNGKGFNNKEREKTNSLGLKLISSLIKQLDGSYKIIVENGTHWFINLNIK